MIRNAWCCIVVAGCLGLGCGSDSSSEATGGAPSSGGFSGFSGNAGKSGGGASGSSGTSGTSGSSGASGTSGTSGTSGSSGTSGVAGTSGTSGSAGSGGQIGDAGISDAGPPGPTDAGLSAYTLECRGNSIDCGDPMRVRCLGVGTMEAPAGFACSNRCETVADCSDAPSGAEAEVDCVQLTAASHCLFVCQHEVRGSFACPSGMSCYVYPGSTIGYCLWQ